VNVIWPLTPDTGRKKVNRRMSLLLKGTNFPFFLWIDFLGSETDQHSSGFFETRVAQSAFCDI
jgi:hypothetical protein